LVLYKAGESEPLEIYRKNRASAYYNLGVVYFKLGDWLKAAEMYSMANRMEQKLKYAQAWGNTMQMWLEAQKGEVDQVNEIVNQQEMKGGIVSTTKSLNAKGVITPVSDAEILKSLERNQQLLLRARELWPLEPALKFAEPPFPAETNNPSLMMDEMMPDTDESELSNPDTPEKPRIEDELIRQVPVTN
jgi:tetratricopeptide (TPR) repeat protein